MNHSNMDRYGMRKIFKIALAGFMLFGLNATIYAGSRDDDLATVSVFKKVLGSEVVYSYSVTNKGVYPLVGFTVGFDYYRGNPELRGTHPSAVVSPAMWTGRVVSLEASDQYEVGWDTNGTAAPIQPGQTLTGFQIRSALDDERFTRSHWTVVVNGPPSNASSLLRIVQGPPPEVDSVPPQITVSLTPNKLWPPNRRMQEITAAITVSDNRDPSPQVRLVSIVCNECPDPDADIVSAGVGTDSRRFSVRADRLGKRKEGRIYTVTYSATDSVGNTASAQATVSVPHDMRR